MNLATGAGLVRGRSRTRERADRMEFRVLTAAATNACRPADEFAGPDSPIAGQRK